MALDWSPQDETVEDENNTVEDGTSVVEVPATIEDAIAKGLIELDSKGRMPGIYLDDMETAYAVQRAEMTKTAHENTEPSSVNVAEINVQSSPLPPLTVTVNNQPNVTTE